MRFLEKPPPRGIMIVDGDNLTINADLSGADNEASIIRGFDNTVRQIARDFGEIVEVFAFLPIQSAYVWSPTFSKLGFWTVVCPGIIPKSEEEERDTVDETLIRFSGRAIDKYRDLSFLCLVSGDRDFSPLIRQVMRRGLKIIVVAASLNSLAGELQDLADSTYLFGSVKAD